MWSTSCCLRVSLGAGDPDLSKKGVSPAPQPEVKRKMGYSQIQSSDYKELFNIVAPSLPNCRTELWEFIFAFCTDLLTLLCFLRHFK